MYNQEGHLFVHNISTGDMRLSARDLYASIRRSDCTNALHIPNYIGCDVVWRNIDPERVGVT